MTDPNVNPQMPNDPGAPENTDEQYVSPDRAESLADEAAESEAFEAAQDPEAEDPLSSASTMTDAEIEDAVQAELAGEYGEKAKIAIRNVRRDGMENLKDDEKKKDISEDERKRSEDDVQKLTDAHVAETDTVVAAKVKEILSQ